MGSGSWAPFAVGLPVLILVFVLVVFALPDTSTSSNLSFTHGICTCASMRKSSDETEPYGQEARASMSAIRGTETQPLLVPAPACAQHHSAVHQTNHRPNPGGESCNPGFCHTFGSLLTAEVSRFVGVFCGSSVWAGVREANDARISKVIVAFFVTSLGRQFLGILLQYVTVRYHWTFAQVYQLSRDV